MEQTEQIIILIVLVILVVPIAFAVWLITKLVRTGERIDELSRRINTLESETLRLRQLAAATSPHESQAQPQPQPQQATSPAPPTKPEPTIVSQEDSSRGGALRAGGAPALPKPPPPPSIPPLVSPERKTPAWFTEAPPPIPTAPKPAQARTPAPPGTGPGTAQAKTPAPLPGAAQAGTPAPLRPPVMSWEQFMGVKGFAWVGGFALFVGVALFIKYAFDNNLIPPAVRVAIGFLIGLGLVIGGIVMSRGNFPALSQTLCATGIVILYAVTFACHSIYHFQVFSVIPTFLVMALITAAAFLLAVRLDALVVAILGMLGGFLTPFMLATGEDNPGGLFGYIAFLDAGLIIVSFRKRWHFLTALAALGTALMQIAWAAEFFVPQQYAEGNKIFVAFAVLLGFNALWLAANVWASHGGRGDGPSPVLLGGGQRNYWLSGSALGLVAVTLFFAWWFLGFPSLAARPWLLFGFIFLVDLVAIAIAVLDETMAIAQTISGLAVFALLATWTQTYLSNEMLIPALVFYFIFAVLHSAVPALLRWQRGGTSKNLGVHLFPIFALALVLVPVFRLTELSFVVWPFVLVVDLLAIVMAAATATLVPVLVVLVLTLAALGGLIFKIPSDLTGLPTSFYLLGAFVIVFVAASIWLVRKFAPDAVKNGLRFGENWETQDDVAAMLPACSILMPFLLLIMATLRLSLVNPAPVFGLALLLVVLLLGVTKLFSLDWMPATGLVALTALECAWHFNHFDPANPAQPLGWVLGWYLIFFAVFAVFPFLFLRQFENKVVSWATSAMAGVPQFFLVYRLVKAAWPNQVMGLLPAAFAIPGLLGLAVILRKSSGTGILPVQGDEQAGKPVPLPAENQARLGQLAWFGGVALFFITAILPVQFEKQWITIGWALEGAALLWLFHRVPHPGLRLVGFGLLIAAFARLALNPAVLDYHPRSNFPILNWYLYAYGIVTVALYIGARLLAPPRHMILNTNAAATLAALGTVLAFLLLNIEIADYFSAPGSTLTFEFSGNFARDMSYSIAWALFALVLLIFGIVKNSRGTRYSAMGLLCVTLIKLFFHDLAQLGQLYRIGAFICVAVIAMLASFAYQKFFTAAARKGDGR